MLLATLEAEIEEERKITLFRDYVGQSLWEINSALYGLGGVDYDRPQYIELAYPETKKKQMTGEEVKQHVLEMLR